MKTAAHAYELVKYFADGRPPVVWKRGQSLAQHLTLEQAQDACRAPSTRKPGEWFIGYREMVPRRRQRVSLTSALIACRDGLGAGREVFTP